MAYVLQEAQRRGIKIRHGADAETRPPTTAVAATDWELPIFYDNRGVESEARNVLASGSAKVVRVVWTPTDTITGGATGPTLNVNKRTTPGVEPAPVGTPVGTATTPAGGAQSGSLPAGTHVYTTTYLNETGNESVVGTSSSAVTTTAGQYVALASIPLGPAGSTARRIYRSQVNTTTPLYLIGQINDNTTTTYNDYGFDYEAAPGAAPTAALAGVGAGNVNAGTHVYGFSYVNQDGEGPVSAASGAVTATAQNGQVTVSGITAGPTGTIARKLYRSTAGNTALLYLATISDNTTTTYTDNVADNQLGAAASTTVGVTPPAAGGTSVTLATITLSAGVNTAAFSPIALPLTGTDTQMFLNPGDVLTFQNVHNSTGVLLTGGRIWVDIDRL